MSNDGNEVQQKIKKFSVNWPTELVARMDVVALRLHTTRTQVILDACEQYVQMFEEYTSHIDETVSVVKTKNEMVALLLESMDDSQVAEKIREIATRRK